MKKMIGIAALVLALSPFAQAQTSSMGVEGHPDARNDRQPETSSAREPVLHKGHHDAKKVNHVKHHSAVSKVK